MMQEPTEPGLKMNSSSPPPTSPLSLLFAGHRGHCHLQLEPACMCVPASFKWVALLQQEDRVKPAGSLLF